MQLYTLIYIHILDVTYIVIRLYSIFYIIYILYCTMNMIFHYQYQFRIVHLPSSWGSSIDGPPPCKKTDMEVFINGGNGGTPKSSILFSDFP